MCLTSPKYLFVFVFAFIRKRNVLRRGGFCTSKITLSKRFFQRPLRKIVCVCLCVFISVCISVCSVEEGVEDECRGLELRLRPKDFWWYLIFDHLLASRSFLDEVIFDELNNFHFVEDKLLPNKRSTSLWNAAVFVSKLNSQKFFAFQRLNFQNPSLSKVPRFFHFSTEF